MIKSICRRWTAGAMVLAMGAWVLLVGTAGALSGIDPAREYQLSHQGYNRQFWTVDPAPPDAKGAKRPAILLLHGGGGRAQGMRWLTHRGFEIRARQNHVLIVYPAGLNGQWNDGRVAADLPENRQEGDDVGFLSTLIDHLAATRQVDPRRVYVGGISNGGFMAFRMACQAPAKVAAVAVVAASMPKEIMSTCKRGTPVSAVLIAGTADPLVPYYGGPVTVRIRGDVQNRGVIPSIPSAARFWAGTLGFDGKKAPAVAPLPDNQPEDGMSVVKTHYVAPRGDVILYTVKNGGHTWPGGLQYAPEHDVGSTIRNFDATQTIWQFFLSHPKR